MLRSHLKLLELQSRSMKWSPVVFNQLKTIDELNSPRLLPLVGNSWVFTPFGYGKKKVNLKETWKRMFEVYGETFRLHMKLGGGWMVATKNIALMDTVMRYEGKFAKRIDIGPMLLYQQLQEQNLTMLVDNTDRWRKLRSWVNPIVLKPRSIQSYMPIHNLVCDETIKVINEEMKEKSKVEKTEDILRRFAIEAVSVICVDKKLNALKRENERDPYVDELIQAVVDLLQYTSKLLTSTQLYLKYPKWSKDFQIYSEANRIFYKVVRHYIKEAEINLRNRKEEVDEERQTTMLEQFLLTYKKAGLEHSDVVNMAGDLLGAAIDTTSVTLQWNLLSLAKYPQVQERVAAEVKSIIGDSSVEITAKLLDKCKLLKSLVKETFRVHPPFEGITRIVEEDFEHDGFAYKKGTAFFLVSANNLLDNNCLPDSQSFNIDRWLKANKESEISPNLLTFMPFGRGVRSCIGRRIAEQEIYLLLAKLLLEYKIEYEDIENSYPEEMQSLMAIPDRSLTFKFYKR
ncbi:hypothetical protein SNEBB_010848 [Seison nebaliae]|nr:hypothetical protein SNEBB_010848 [Seison nebaliae]